MEAPSEGSAGIRVSRLGVDDAGRVLEAGRLFDHAPEPSWTERFLLEPTHHLLIAYIDDEPAGFVSGIEMTHPDKGTEMFVYELGVAPERRRRGVATALLGALVAIARERGCYGMWVLTDDANVAAVASYHGAGAVGDSRTAMFTWTFDQAG